jgi:hypothetical protein
MQNFTIHILFIAIILTIPSCKGKKELAEEEVIKTLLKTKTYPDIFADSNFTFQSLDFLSEQLLFANGVDDAAKFLQGRKKFRPEHCKFFKTGCSNSFWDDYTFLVSKQDIVGLVLPVIIHDSKDFNYYHSTLYTIDTRQEKIDSLIVSLWGFSQDCDCDTSAVRHISSHFINDRIITTEYTILDFGNGSTVTTDSIVGVHRITQQGKIIGYNQLE